MLGELPGDPSGDLAAMPVRDLLMIYGNWLGRRVPPRPRTVHRSTQLDASTAAGTDKAELDTLVAKIEAGEDIKPHLSTAIETAYVPGATLAAQPWKGERALDRMLADWGIHHLHPSSTLLPDGFTERTRELLFAVFRPDDAYLIGIYPHGAWAMKELIEVIVDNWSDAGIVHEFGYVQDITHKPSDAERYQERKAGIGGSLFEINGRVYGMLGQTAAGTPMLVAMRVQELMWRLWDLRENLTERLEQYAALADETVGRPLSGAWTPAVHEGWAGLAREGVFVPLGPLS